MICGVQLHLGEYGVGLEQARRAEVEACRYGWNNVLARALGQQAVVMLQQGDRQEAAERWDDTDPFAQHPSTAPTANNPTYSACHIKLFFYYQLPSTGTSYRRKHGVIPFSFITESPPKVHGK